MRKVPGRKSMSIEQALSLCDSIETGIGEFEVPDTISESDLIVSLRTLAGAYRTIKVIDQKRKAAIKKAMGEINRL